MAVELPHFAYPFGRTADGKAVAVVEQSSGQHISGQEYAVVVTPQGYRIERPDFGWPWPEFANVPLDLGPLQQALRSFVPDSDAKVTEWADAASEAIRHIRIEEEV